ncbi:outer membrane protein assembly factor BamB family protein [Candidatus Entotheonella palauensis]|uniref:outer membrane protein assembly factor BamB family protein n=1 Tax=Candidatus Entotheonella palauensis TaxID=93172 RepID=UPI0015C4A731|nr:PQQ-binding-like beta-propeller repeat protein [Candidatus Entotheonella palauensis]
MAKDMKTLQPVESCPWCGADDRTAWGTCRACGRYYLPQGWERAPRQQRSFWWLAIGLGVAVILAAWIMFPFLPGPRVLLFQRPTTQLTSGSPANQWTMQGLNLAQNRYVSTPPRHLAGRLVWSADLGSSTRSAPVIVNGIIYIGGHFRVLALDAHTGRLRQEIPTTGPVHPSVAVAGDTLYVGLQDWRVLALNRRTGQTQWAFSTQNPIAGSATVAKGLVYIGSRDGFLYALDAVTGRLIWKFKTEGYPLSPPALTDKTLFVSSTEGILYALHARTGRLRLRFHVPERLQDVPVAANGLVYFPSGGQLYAVDASAREYPGQHQLNLVWAQFWLWQIPGVPQPPGQPGGRWRFSYRNRPQAILSAPAVTHEAFYVGDFNGYLYARDAQQATPRWQFKAESGVRTSPLILGSRVYFGTHAGVLYALDRAQGALLWQLDLGVPIETAPVYASGRIYIWTSNGQLHAIE